MSQFLELVPSAPEPEERGPEQCALGKSLFACQFIATLIDANHRLIDADHRKDEFMAMMGHELRNPLAAVANALEIIRRKERLHPDSEIAWACEVLNRQFAQLSRLVADLLDIARIARGNLMLCCEAVNLNAVIDDAVETSGPMLNQRRQRLLVEATDPPLQVMGDSGRLVQVFDNLLTNASKYMHEGGRIWLTLRRDGDQAVCTVTDEGRGIAADKLESIFEAFTQLHTPDHPEMGGIGMGLAIARQLLTLHHGSVRATSGGPDQGSSFEVRLPLIFPGETRGV
jgi:signal transduction histidine kinase